MPAWRCWASRAPVDATDTAAVRAVADRFAPDLVVVGADDPLVAGVVDALADGGHLAFGPNAAAARLEGSKKWMKDVLTSAGVPTAAYRAFGSEAEAAAFAFLESLRGMYVVKTDGLAAGKGVVVTESLAEARDAVRSYLSGAAFGDAGRTCVIEEGLRGPEVSLFVLCDGRGAVPLAVAQDHKRAFDGEVGPNTGGMGAVLARARDRPRRRPGRRDDGEGDPADARRAARGAAPSSAACCSADSCSIP